MYTLGIYIHIHMIIYAHTFTGYIYIHTHAHLVQDYNNNPQKDRNVNQHQISEDSCFHHTLGVAKNDIIWWVFFEPSDCQSL